MTKLIKTTNLVEGKPATIEINESTDKAFAQAAALIRDGYQFSKVTQPCIFPHNGEASLTLVLGDPDVNATAAAAESLSIALIRQNAQDKRDELVALAQSQAEQERQAKRAKLAEEVAQAKATLKQLEQAQSRA